MNTTAVVTLSAPQREVLDWLVPKFGREGAENLLRRMPGLTMPAIKQLDKLLYLAHGCQTEVEAAYAHGRLHYRATGPVLSFGEYEDWGLSAAESWKIALGGRYVKTRGLCWSGHSRYTLGATAAAFLASL